MTRIGLLLLPSYAVGNVLIPKLSALKDLAFEQQSKPYKDYLRSGDLLKINK